MKNKITAKIYPLFHKLCKLLKITIYFDNKYGIKAFNKKGYVLKDESIINKITLNPKKLYLSFDGLKDEYTLLDMPLIESPHYNLMNDIMHKTYDPTKEEYVIREINGYLDGRYEILFDENISNLHVEKFYENYNKIMNGTYDPLTIYLVDNKYYLLDGKHRAAIACLNNIKLKCNVISVHDLATDKYTKELFNMLLKNKDNYLKNINHLEKIFKQENDNEKN